jgi:hypothetical protein
MASLIDSLSTDTITEDNLKYIELYNGKLRPGRNINKSPIHITPQQANKYIFNFHGLLTEVVNKDLTFADKYFLTKLNGYDTSSDYDGKNLIIYTIDTNRIMSE